jgi:hypothetical protein
MTKNEIPVTLAGVKDPDDVRMIDYCGRLRFLQEQRPGLRVVGQIGCQRLQ